MRRPSWGVIGACAVLSAVCGCGSGEPEERPGDLERDTIEIGPELTFDPVPLTAIGGARGDSLPGHAVYLVRDAALLDGEGLVVADYMQRLLYFDGRGAFRQQVGREGTGPGEFARIRSLHRSRDRRIAHIAHHHPTSVVVHALLTLLAMCLERLYRLRYLRRGTHPPYSAIEFNRILWLNLAGCEPYDSS